jgi:two-component system sensor histidine kinase BaeS
LLQQALSELFANAFRHQPTGGAFNVTARSEGNFIVFKLHEPKENFELSLENWGREPLRKIGQGHYGLGLNRVRGIIEAHGGKFGAQFDGNTSTLVTTIVLPLSGQPS